MFGYRRAPAVVAMVAIGASLGCRTSTSQIPLSMPSPMPRVTPAEKPANTIDAPAVSNHPWRPVHKGGASLSSGVYTRVDDDLVVNTPLPIVLRRTYNSGDGFSRRFGLDANHAGEWWLRGNSDPRVPWAELILPSGSRIRFTRISPGETREGAVLRHDSSPSEFNGALLSWSGSRWEMRFQDGGTAAFKTCEKGPAVCSLIERTDREGHRIDYVRDPSGTLLRMESEGQSIAFDYDDQRRIVRAYDTSQHAVSYLYDDRGRLIQASGTDGVVRRYEYDEGNHLVGVREPGRILQNWFDEAGRWVKQVLKDSEQDPHPYVATARYVVEDGAIVETDFNEGDGLIIERYNTHRYIVSETLDADGPAPIVFAYALDPISNVSTGATMSCVGPSGPVTRTAPIASTDHGAKEALIRESCPRHR